MNKDHFSKKDVRVFQQSLTQMKIVSEGVDQVIAQLTKTDEREVCLFVADTQADAIAG